MIKAKCPVSLGSVQGKAAMLFLEAQWPSPDLGGHLLSLLSL